jgi:hypothetical protein
MTFKDVKTFAIRQPRFCIDWLGAEAGDVGDWGIAEEKNLAEPQLEPFYNLIQFLSGNESNCTFIGGAGTGKTYVLCQVYKYYCRWFEIHHERHPAVIVLAPSHKAKRNASSMGKENGVNFEARTISSFLGLSPVLDEESGKEEFRKSDKAERDFIESDEYDLIIVDEAFMVSREHIELIIQSANGAKILWVGDPKQLPPIGEERSHLLSLDFPTVELTQIIRYSGDLARVAESWRSSNMRERLPITQTEDGSITELNRFEWIDRFANNLKATLATGSPSDAPRLLAWTNAATLKWANWTRDILYGDSTVPFYVGEILICRKPLFRKVASSKKRDKFEIVCDNGTEFEVIGNDEARTMFIGLESYEYYWVPCRSLESGNRIDLQVLTESSERRLMNDLRDAKKLKKWALFYELTKTFDDVCFAFCLTVHKSQGSTYSATYLDLPNISKCPDKRAIVYTALTRSKQCYVLR